MFEYNVEEHRDEIILRGLYLTMSADIEWILTEMTCFCLSGDVKQREKFKLLFFERLTMGTKLSKAKLAVADYDEEIFKKYEETFKRVSKLSGYRNLFAHSRIKITGDNVEFRHIKNGKDTITNESKSEFEKFLLECRAEVHRLLYLIVEIDRNRRKNLLESS